MTEAQARTIFLLAGIEVQNIFDAEYLDKLQQAIGTVAAAGQLPKAVAAPVQDVVRAVKHDPNLIAMILANQKAILVLAGYIGPKCQKKVLEAMQATYDINLEHD